jgi:Cdc6-like AAA superfamily ATPase
MPGRELKQLFKAYREGDELAFRRAAQEIIEDEESKQHMALARDLRKIIAGGSGAAVAEGVALPAPPMDREGDWPLAEIRHPEQALSELVLPGPLLERLHGLAAEFARWDDLDRHFIPRRQRLLFYGPPGCGKTSAAEAIAAELGLPLLIIRLDAVVSSYLGETASNLHRVFDYARSGSWVLLFDEFDALGKARDDPSEHGEIKRVITAFLQMLDGFRGSSLLIAATNHEQLLDSALWRRFDEVLTFPRPTVHQLRKVLRLRLRGTQHRGLDIEAAASELKGLPYAAAEKAVWDARRSALLSGRSVVEDRDISRAVADIKTRPW